MLATGILYSHHEHIQALKDQLSYDPLRPAEIGALLAASNGAKTNKYNSMLVWKARMRLSAPSRPSAFYNLLAIGSEVDPRRLTDREVQAIRLLASGADAGEIGEALGYATKAAQRNNGYNILKSARSKLVAENNVHLLRIAYRFRIIEPGIGSPSLPPWTP